ncbi:hypothetical protein AB4520_14500 [Vibrio renipiscarius]|uniref:hypothetical protein n=1 Tax=Vibrio renipiscarius TaxID=1461322 RepID=UPI00354DB403
MLNKTLVAAALVSVLSGCAPSSVVCNPNSRVDLDIADVQSKNSEDVKVIVLPVDIAFKDSAKQRLQAVILNDIESTVTQSGSELIDRKLASKLKNEIKLAEQSGRYNTNGVPIADIAIMSEVTASNLFYSFTERDTYKNKKGETKVIPAHCDFRTEVKTTLKVVSLPEMRLIQRIELEGTDTSKTETNDSDCPMTQGSYIGMAIEAAQSSIEQSLALQKVLAPSATVMEMRQCDEGMQLKISMGKNKNIQPNSPIIISQIFKSDEGELEIYPLGEGYVIDNEINAVGTKHSWVDVDDEIGEQVKKGDHARFVPKCNWYDIACTLTN